MLKLRKSLVLAAFLSVAGGFGVSGAFAQGGAVLPSPIINSQTPLSATQLQVVDQFVKTAVGQILNGADPAAIAKGRKALQGQFGGGVSTAFILDYSKVIVDTVISTKALDPTKSLALRLNTIIVLTNCVDDRMPAIFEEALKDPNPGVRYWAAIAANQYLDAALINPAFQAKTAALAGDKQQETILKGLRGVRDHATVGLIADQVLLALSKLTIPEARSVVLARLNERVTLHAATPEPDVSADHRALTAFVVRLVGGTPLATEEMRNLAKLTYREMMLSLEMLEKLDKRGQGQANPQQQQVFTNMLLLSEKWLTWSYEGLTKTTGVVVVPNFAQSVPLMAWSKIRLGLIDFRDQKLMKEPVGLKGEELETDLMKSP